MRNVELKVRPLRDEEIDDVIELWHVTKQVAYPYLPLEQGRTLAEDSAFFRDAILPRTTTWVACSGEAVVGFMAMEGSYIDRLYIHPDHQGQGVGSALMQLAMERCPTGLQLHTHQENAQARAFYERRGFRAVKFGISSPPESAPDVEYHWTRD